jgi:hypothetical protein
MFDRWLPTFVGGGATCSSQVATVGTNLGGTEVTNYLRTVTTGQTGASVATFPQQKIEDVRTFANQTVLVSFWAKAATGTPKIAVEFSQYFNSGGGGSATVQTYGGQVTLTTDWARYSVSVAIPSISGKTIASGNALVLNLWVSAGTDFSSRTGSLGIQSNTFDIWGVQVEAASTGSTASPFQTASGSIGGELALCQRYYYRLIGDAGFSQVSGIAPAASTTTAYIGTQLPVTMRVRPSAVDSNTISISDGTTRTALSSLTIGSFSTTTVGIVTAVVASGLTQYRPYFLQENAGGTAAYLGFSAEL